MPTDSDLVGVNGSLRAADVLTRTFGIDGKTAIVTGAGSGIGKATARLFASVGANVVLVGLHYEKVRLVAEEIQHSGGRAFAIEADVSEEEAVKAATAETVRQYGGVDILVNNAAYRPKAAFIDMEVQQWDRMHSVNTRGTFLFMREAIKVMRVAKIKGVIVNVSTIGSLHPVAFNNAHYNSSKAGINAITQTAALEFAEDGIRVNAVLPGYTRTEGSQNVVASGLVARGPMMGPNRNLFGSAQACEIANTILFLASPAASFITGHLLVADGGFSVS